jgi:plastocyanin
MNYRGTVSAVVSVVFLVLLSACGGGGGQQTAEQTTQSMDNGASGGNGSLVATVNFQGTEPEPETYDASGNSECDVNTIESEKVVVNDNGTLKNVVVAVKSGPSGLDKSPEPVSVDQVDCMYTPRVVTAKTGQSITFKDSDPSMHNVRATQDGSQVFNITTFQGTSKQQSFSDAGVYSLVCNVHPWMQGWVYVTDHGYASVTGESGTASLDNLPAGEYTLEFWHEEYGTQTKSVSIEDGQEATVSVSFGG